ncbi:UBX domain-containing protein, partial [Cephalotus follicularis]
GNLLKVKGLEKQTIVIVQKKKKKNKLSSSPKTPKQFTEEMEQSLSSLTYKGSINEAIIEAKRGKKLLVVYISGEDADSVNLENNMWTDIKVAESLSKYCILLHIPGGSTDAANFSAIYPQKLVPCITAVGYNGVQVWQSEGFVSSEDLTSSLEKAWLNLHFQETTVTVLTAALALKKPESSTSRASVIASSEQGGSSTVVLSPSKEKDFQLSEAGQSVTSEMMEESNDHECTVEKKSVGQGDKTFSGSFTADSASLGNKQPSSSAEPAKGIASPITVDLGDSGADPLNFSAENGLIATEKAIDHHSDVAKVGAPLTANEANEVVQDEKAKADALDSCKQVSKSNDVHLNIRLLNGVSLQEKFSVTSTLRMIKDYVDENLESGIGSYDLAIPYPRKVFSDQELGKSLSELGLFSRQALIVVQHQRGTSYQRGGSLSSNQMDLTTNSDSLDGGDEGYFAYLKRFLSYVNPFSYLRGSSSSSSSGQRSQSGMWQYSPNHSQQNNLAESGRPYSSNSLDEPTSATGRTDGRSRQPTTSRFGSNIHTLKRDEDDDQFNGRNPFWNGNSTQYGGGPDGN